MFCFLVTVSMPPENTTVRRGSSVTISCGYQWSRALVFTWIINGTSFSPQEILDSPLYQLNNPTSPNSLSLTVFSINGTTTFQCVLHSTLKTISTQGTVNVIGVYILSYLMYVSNLHIHSLNYV